MSEQEELNRILWRCRRGMLELDRFLLPFGEREYVSLTREQQQLFQTMLELPDPVLFAWLMGHEEADELYKEMVELIRNAARL